MRNNNSRRQQGAGRPRNPEVERRALEAARSIYGESGKSYVTFSNVAARASIGKAALYRRWASPVDLLMDALRSIPLPGAIADLGDVQTELAQFCRALMELYVSPDGAALMRLTTEFHDETEPFRQWITDVSRSMIAHAETALDRAIQRGESVPNMSAEAVTQVLTGTVLSHTVYRLHADQPIPRHELGQFCWNLAGLALGRVETTRKPEHQRFLAETHATETVVAGGRKANLIRIAQQVAASRGFAELTLADIAKSAGLTTPALYTHFASRAELIEQVLEVTAREYVEDLAQTDEPSGSVEVRLRTRLHRWAAMPTPRLRLLNDAVLHIHDSVRVKSAIQRARGAWDAFVRDVLAKGVDRGEVRRDVDLDVAVELLTSCLFGVEVASDTGLAESTLLDLSDRLVDMFLAYVGGGGWTVSGIDERPPSELPCT